MAQNIIWEGEVVALCIAPAADEPMQLIDEAQLVEGRGIVGDRYYTKNGTHSVPDEEAYEITLIESEAFESVETENKLSVSYADMRRNIVTRGFSLNHLVNREFRIGDTVLRGIALREPCAHLMEQTSHKVVVGFIHRGGLGAQIISGGNIRLGDTIHE
ncbi:molybdenum cofactor sulfurase [Dictyobacter alpinus]|uniref:Molybdenum cofactor sulfurase n=1 Tax=Dictyobacter alpinus TaxID=2014873 RepID=A0A402B7Q9_9CHLR|nr:MOSC domain-containing protein [Dictyobacter alpinus]GCE27359.1 molybdenum cofactor sulfurase [Dictyobacter alpinus]